MWPRLIYIKLFAFIESNPKAGAFLMGSSFLLSLVKYITVIGQLIMVVCGAFMAIVTVIGWFKKEINKTN